jgi:hypothetical protein
MPRTAGNEKESVKMTTLFVRHTVEDFDAWKAAYDAFDAERRTMGVTGQGAYRVVDSPGEVTVYHEFDSLDAARSFVASARLQEVMESAGVTGSPQIWFAEKA